MVSVVIENKDLLTWVKEPQNVPLEEGNTAQRDLPGLATLGLIRWVINPCAVLRWILTTLRLSCSSEKAEIILHLELYFLVVQIQLVKAITCKLKIHQSKPFKWSEVSAKF